MHRNCDHFQRKVVGAARFELTTSASQTRRSTRLSYAPVHTRTLEDSADRIKNFLNKYFNCHESAVDTPEFPIATAKNWD